MANADTVQKRMSLLSYLMPWRGPMVAMADENNLGETYSHVGTKQSLVGLYGGVMAITYGKGVYSGSTLGTLLSDSASAGTQLYFLSLDDVLPVGELATSAAASSNNTSLTIASPAVSSAAYSTNDGTVVAPIGRAVEFRVTLPTAAFADSNAQILVQYATDGSNTRDAFCFLNIKYVP
jgi:hypothetical protein